MSHPDNFLEGQRILLTGGTGSVGKMLVARLFSGRHGHPSRVVVLSRDENKQTELRQLYTQVAASNVTSKRLQFRMADVRNYDEICGALKQIDVVINAAALKQVPSCEYYPEQAIKTNCLGPMNIVRAISENDFPVHTVLGVSTDKAVTPISVMGMTKALQERLFAAANLHNPGTRFISCRYGNVMGTRRSVIPLFREQIERGGPVTVTVPHMTRFLMSIDEAIDCVIDTLQHALPGDTFVPMSPSTTIENLAKALIGKRPIKIQVTGQRPGDRLHESLICDEEAPRVRRRGNCYAIRSILPELHQEEDASVIGLTKAYSSANTLINLEQTIALLRKNRLLPEQHCEWMRPSVKAAV